MIYEHQIISTLECGHRRWPASNVLTPSIMKTLDWINWQIENERGWNIMRENEAIADLLDSDKKWFMWLQFVSGPVLFPVFARAISGAVICCHLIWTVREKPVAARGEILLNITSDINYVLTIKSCGRKPISSSSHHKLGYCCYCL